MTGAAHNRGKSKQDYSTPWEVIRAVESRFGPIAFDLAADATNAKAARYFTKAEDSLSQDWTRLHGTLWLNPPFASIAPWARKCAESICRIDGRIAFLVPAAVGSNWFADYVHNWSLVLPLRPRLSFDGKHPYPKDVMLCVYGVTPRFEPWRWKS